MTDDWRDVTFGDTAELVRDSIQPSECPDAPYIGLEHIGEGTLALTGHGVATDVSSLKSRFQRGDILFGKLRPYFRKVIRAPFDGICSTDIWVVRPTEEIDAGYLFYVMASESFVEFATRGSEGTRMPRAQWEHVSQFELRLPPMGEQRRIAGILGCLDDKIELNRRMAETLEQMARALFRSWFVDFEPVRAKQEGRWSPAQSLPGLPAHLYDSFPDRLEPSPLGPIPAGWQVVALGDVVELAGGGTPSTKRAEFWDGGEHCWATPRDLAALTSPVLLDTERKITDAGLARISSGLLPEGTLLMSSRAPIGYLAIANVPVAINQGFIAITAQEGMSNLFMLHWCRAFHERIMTYANGSTFLEISKANFRQVPLVVPDAAVVEAFNSVVRPLTEQIAARAHETQCVAAQRDTLLPRLIGGESPPRRR